MAGTLLPSAAQAQKNANRPATTWGQRLKALAALFSTRILRGGPRLLIQVTACLVVLFFFISLMPSRLSAGYESILEWSNPMPREARDLRVVAFGSQDLAGSAVPANQESDRVPWTKVLCKQVSY